MLRVNIIIKPTFPSATLTGKWEVLIELGFNNTSTFVGHFVSSPREREIRDKSRGDEREGQRRKRNRNESEKTEEIKTFLLYPYCYKDSRPYI